MGYVKGDRECSLHPIDYGWDVRGVTVDLSDPAIDTVVYEANKKWCKVTGDKVTIVKTLAKAGFQRIVCEKSPDGRDIVYSREMFRIQPQGVDRWVKADTLEEARDAYYHPEKYRPSSGPRQRESDSERDVYY